LLPLRLADALFFSEAIFFILEYKFGLVFVKSMAITPWSAMLMPGSIPEHEHVPFSGFE
jgi:hypothetical protein